MQQEAGYRFLGNEVYDWLFSELLAVLKCHGKAGIVHARVSALFLEVHSPGWNSWQHGQYGFCVAAGIFQRKVFEKGLRNGLGVSRESGYHLDTSVIIKQILTWLESIPSKLSHEYSEFPLCMSWLLVISYCIRTLMRKYWEDTSKLCGM